MTTPNAQSVWTKPLPPIPRRFLRWVGGVCIAVVAGLIIYPSASSTLTWLLHRSVSYRGLDVPVPFRWVQSRQGIWLTIERPAWNLGFPSELTIEKSKWNAKDQMSSWAKMQSALQPQYPAGAAPDTFTDIGGDPLLCFENMTPRFIMMSCISRDATWTFNYVGTAKDARDINKTVQYLLARQGDFH